MLCVGKGVAKACIYRSRYNIQFDLHTKLMEHWALYQFPLNIGIKHVFATMYMCVQRNNCNYTFLNNVILLEDPSLGTRYCYILNAINISSHDSFNNQECINHIALSRHPSSCKCTPQLEVKKIVKKKHSSRDDFASCVCIGIRPKIPNFSGGACPLP